MKNNLLNIAHGFMLLAWLIFGFTPQVTAQENHCWSEEELRLYYHDVNRHLQAPNFFQRCDTLMQEATRAHNEYYQGMVFYVKSSHYYYADDLKGLQQVLKDAWAFVRNRQDKTIPFFVWGRLINYYYRHHENLTATRELYASLNKAREYNNAYGIVISYRSFGAIYNSQGLYEESIQNYQHAADYAEKHYEREYLPIYQKILGVYERMGNYDKIIEICQKIMPQAKKSWRTEALILSYWLDATMRKEDWALAKRQKARIDSLVHGQYQPDAEKITHLQTSIIYYTRTRQLDSARVHLDRLIKLNPNNIKTHNRRVLYFNFAGPADSLLKAMQDKIAFMKVTPLVADIKDPLSQINSFNINQVLADTKQLGLKNSELKIAQINANKHLLQIDQRRNLLKMRNQQLTLENAKAEVQQRQNLIQRQKEKSSDLQFEEQATRHRQTLLIILSAVLITIAAFYAYVISRARRRLNYEKMLALKAEEEAKAADISKMNFLQNVSHEIRTPLNAIVGFNEILNDQDIELGAQEKEEYGELIQRNIQSLSLLINLVLDLSKLESGTYQLQLMEATATELCARALMEIEGKAQPNVTVAFVNELPAETLLLTDSVKLLQALTIFLKNACKYTKEGKITLYARPTQRLTHTASIQFTVEDTGTGIPTEQGKYIFDSFTKLNAFEQGFGIGLNICLLVAHLLHGQTWLDTSYTKGARFCLEIPLVYKEEASDDESTNTPEP